MTSLRGYAQLLLRQIDRAGQPNPERLRRALAVIDEQSARLSSLVEELLDVSRLEAGKLALQRRVVDVAELLRRVVSTVSATTDRHTVTLRAEGALFVDADPLRLEQVVTNLLENAIRYSPEGGPIEVVVSAASDQLAVVSVTDRGIGIAPARQARLFERFYQAHGEGLSGGMGLGLYISRQIVEQHGGTIAVRSRLGEGSTFTLRLPLAPPGLAVDSGSS